MRWLFLFVISMCTGSLPAIDLAASDANCLIYARRALLREPVREVLALERGAKFDDLDQVRKLQLDLDGDEREDLLIALRKGDSLALAVFTGGARGTGAEAFNSVDGVTAAGSVCLRKLTLHGFDYVVIESTHRVETGEKDFHETTRAGLYRYVDGAIKEALSYVTAETVTSGGGRVRRETTTALTTSTIDSENTLALCATTLDHLDGKQLAGSKSVTTRLYSHVGKGDIRPGALTSAPAPVACRLAVARELERAGLAADALTHAREGAAVARTANLAPDDPRRLDATALVERLKARAAVASA